MLKFILFTLQLQKSKSPNIFRGKRRRRTRPLLLRREPTVSTGKTEKPNTQTTVEHAHSQQPTQTSKSFTSALAEINKRLQNQSKLWACLASGLPLSANT